MRKRRLPQSRPTHEVRLTEAEMRALLGVGMRALVDKDFCQQNGYLQYGCSWSKAASALVEIGRKVNGRQ